MQRSGIY